MRLILYDGLVRSFCMRAGLVVFCALFSPVAHGQQKAPSPIPSKSHSQAAAPKAPSPDLGSIRDGVYRNLYFHASYKIPISWVDRTGDMRQAAEAGKGLVLLAIFERPPEATGETVNSAVVIAAEPLASYPGLKTAADYFGPLTELATGKGFKVVNEPFHVMVSGKPLVRSDFSKALGQLSMQQASLVEVDKGYFLSFTFIGASDDEVSDLAGRLSLGEPSGRPTKSR